VDLRRNERDQSTSRELKKTYATAECASIMTVFITGYQKILSAGVAAKKRTHYTDIIIREKNSVAEFIGLVYL
jgi:hypothetical protein